MVDSLCEFIDIALDGLGLLVVGAIILSLVVGMIIFLTLFVISVGWWALLIPAVVMICYALGRHANGGLY